MLSQLMKRVAGRQTRYVNKLEKRSGSLWEGRFKSSIVSTSEYLQACCRYIELNPIRASVVVNPADHKWSSFNCLANGKSNPVVDQRPCYKSLGKNGPERQEAWKAYLFDTIDDYERKLIREALQCGQVTGGDKFQQEISEKLGIRLSNKRPGRPKKVKN